MSPSKDVPDLSIVVPALDEEPNLRPLVDEVERGVLAAGIDAELIVVDDGSTDGTLALLAALSRERPWLRAISLGGRCGQSAAFRAGILAARAPLVGMLDADLQNDPADLARLAERARSGGADLVQGARTLRRDSFTKKLASWVGWRARRLLLGDATRDTGCSLRVLRAETARALPLELRGLHRFVPFWVRATGGRVEEVPVSHRARTAGRTKYGLLDRAGEGLVDCLGVLWMSRRLVRPPHPAGGEGGGKPPEPEEAGSRLSRARS